MTKRLPQNYIPTHYNLFLHITEGKSLFDASVSISFKENKPDEKIYWHIHNNITIKQITQNGNSLDYTVEYPHLLISIPSSGFSSSPIQIDYTVKPDLEQNFGLFVSDTNVLTDFEPNGARQLLPCYDEPFVLASFTVRLLIPSKLTGLSNMPIEKTIENTKENEKEIIFLPTPPICSYLLCICVGPFKSITCNSKSGVPIHFFTETSKESFNDHYLKIATFAFDWIEDHFNVHYELPHLQIISCNGFTRAMENYGLITLLPIGSNPFMMSELMVIHEVIHQWFGDLVSIKYWDSLWLNEGITNFLQFLIYDDWPQSDFKPHALFDAQVKCECNRYFKEGVLAPHESEIIVDDESLISQLYYKKGAFVSSMLCDLLGKEKFFEVCSKWLSEFKNKTADINDFELLVNSTTGKNYSSFFNYWLRDVGFPTVIVKEKKYNEENDKFNGVVISQYSPKDAISLRLTVIYRNGDEIKREIILLNEIEKKLDIEFDWIMVNETFDSLCYVVYTKELVKALSKFNSKEGFTDMNYSVILNSVLNKPVPEMIDEEMKQLCFLGTCTIFN